MPPSRAFAGPSAAPCRRTGTAGTATASAAWSSSSDASACSLVVIETTAGFTCVTRSVKSGSLWPVMPLPGGFTGATGVASEAAKPAWPTARPPSAVPANRTPAMAVRRQCRGARGVSVERLMVAPSETSWTSKAASQCGAADTERKCTRSGERSLGAAIKPLSCRLNLCHSSDRYGLDGYAAAWVEMGWQRGRLWQVAPPNTCKSWPNGQTPADDQPAGKWQTNSMATFERLNHLLRDR